MNCSLLVSTIFFIKYSFYDLALCQGLASQLDQTTGFTLLPDIIQVCGHLAFWLRVWMLTKLVGTRHRCEHNDTCKNPIPNAPFKIWLSNLPIFCSWNEILTSSILSTTAWCLALSTCNQYLFMSYMRNLRQPILQLNKEKYLFQDSQKHVSDIIMKCTKDFVA